MESKKNFELNDDMLDQVSGGSYYDDGSEFYSCPYCLGYIFYKRNYVDIPYEQLKCENCGYMPAFPETAPTSDPLPGWGV